MLTTRIKNVKFLTSLRIKKRFYAILRRKILHTGKFTITEKLAFKKIKEDIFNRKIMSQ